MARVLAPFGRRRAEVTANRESGSYRVFSVSDSGPKPAPGQFYMLAAAQRWDSADERPYLPRAFSVALAESKSGGLRLHFLVEDVGPGTVRLAALEEGEGLWLTGPLGRSFSDPPPGAEIVLVGGGIGVAPLAILERRLLASGISPRILLGFRDRNHAGGVELFEGEPELASDDGHAGHRGFVTDLLVPLLEGEDGVAVFACGPPPMLETVRALCGEHEVACELAMESGMACGFGACFGCVVPTRDGYIRLCVDGPVVDAREIETALVPGSGH